MQRISLWSEGRLRCAESRGAWLESRFLELGDGRTARAQERGPVFLAVAG